MAKICRNCDHLNLDTSHYCVKCGKPLECGLFGISPTNYIVVPEDDYVSLRKQINDSWGMKIEKWIKGNIITIGWIVFIVLSFMVGCFMGWLLHKAGFVKWLVDVFF